MDLALGCQTSSGGFAHAPMALPNLEFDMTGSIHSIHAIKVLDSQGMPTLRVFVHLQDGRSRRL